MWETRHVGDATCGRRQGRHSYQPRATPWVHHPKTPSALKARLILRPTSRQPATRRQSQTYLSSNSMKQAVGLQTGDCELYPRCRLLCCLCYSLRRNANTLRAVCKLHVEISTKRHADSAVSFCVMPASVCQKRVRLGSRAFLCQKCVRSDEGSQRWRRGMAWKIFRTAVFCKRSLLTQEKSGRCGSALCIDQIEPLAMLLGQLAPAHKKVHGANVERRNPMVNHWVGLGLTVGLPMG